jgi:hypothetical protein
MMHQKIQNRIKKNRAISSSVFFISNKIYNNISTFILKLDLHRDKRLTRFKKIVSLLTLLLRNLHLEHHLLELPSGLASS